MSSEQSVTEMPESAAPVGDVSGGYEINEDGERVPHGMGQSKSSRRRRRKRKGKGPEASGGEAGQAAEGGEGDSGGSIDVQAQASPVVGQVGPRPQGRSFQANGQPGGSFAGQGAQGQGFQAGSQPGGFQGGQNGNAPGGTKRWKKKFRDRERPRFDGQGQNGSGQQAGASGQAAPQGFRGPDTHQPGNGGGFKRKTFGKQQGGQRTGGSRSGFVGPMDHSYRAVNGNVFDAGASTIDTHASHGGGRGRSYQSDSQPIDYSQGRAIPIAPGTPTRIYFFIEDLFFTAKISETARKLGVKVAFVKNEKEQIAALTSGEEDTRPGLIVFDLNNANAKPMTLIPKLKTKLKKSASIIGFLSHLQGDLKAKAVEAGCDTVMPRAAFSQNLPNLLRRYGVEEVEENVNYNQ